MYKRQSKKPLWLLMNHSGKLVIYDFFIKVFFNGHMYLESLGGIKNKTWFSLWAMVEIDCIPMMLWKQVQPGLLEQTLRLSALGSLCDSQLPAVWFAAISGVARIGGKKSWTAAGKLLQLWSIKERSLQSLTFIKTLLPSSVTVWFGCLARHRLIKSAWPIGLQRWGGGSEGVWTRGDRKLGRQSWRGKRSKCSETALLFCYHDN